MVIVAASITCSVFSASRSSKIGLLLKTSYICCDKNSLFSASKSLFINARSSSIILRTADMISSVLSASTLRKKYFLSRSSNSLGRSLVLPAICIAGSLTSLPSFFKTSAAFFWTLSAALTRLRTSDSSVGTYFVALLSTIRSKCTSQLSRSVFISGSRCPSLSTRYAYISLLRPVLHSL